MRDAVVAALAIAGVSAAAICCVGIAVVEDPFDRLHFASAATTVPPVLLGTSVLFDSGWTSSGMTAVVVMSLMVAFGPVLAHGVGRLARVRLLGSLEPTQEELERGS